VLAVHLSDVVHAADIRMGHLARDPHLVVKARQRALVAPQACWQEFQRDRLPQCEIRRAVDFSHASAPQQARDPVAPGKHGSRQEASFIDAG